MEEVLDQSTIFQCPSCDSFLEASLEYIGAKVRCTGCNEKFQISKENMQVVDSEELIEEVTAKETEEVPTVEDDDLPVAPVITEDEAIPVAKVITEDEAIPVAKVITEDEAIPVAKVIESAPKSAKKKVKLNSSGSKGPNRAKLALEAKKKKKSKAPLILFLLVLGAAGAGYHFRDKIKQSSWAPSFLKDSTVEKPK